MTETAAALSAISALSEPLTVRTRVVDTADRPGTVTDVEPATNDVQVQWDHRDSTEWVGAEFVLVAAATCATCGQALTFRRTVTGPGRQQGAWCADDGWGSICGDAPDGGHAPAAPIVGARAYPTPPAGYPRGFVAWIAGPHCTRSDGSTYRVAKCWRANGRFESARTGRRYDLVNVELTGPTHPDPAPACEACSGRGAIMVEVEAVDGKPLGYREIDCPECR